MPIQKLLTLYSLIQIQIKTTMRYYFVSTRRAKIKKTDDTDSWQGYGATGTFINFQWEVNFTSTLENCFAVSYTLNRYLTYLTIPLLGIYPNGLTTNIHIYVQGLYTNVYSSFNNTSQLLETIEMYIIDG